jgi:hypothetical protein
MRTTLRTLAALCISFTVATVAVGAISTQGDKAANQTASQFYMAYRAAFDKATTIDDVLPYMAADMRKQIEATPVADRAQMFGVIKAMGALTDVKVLKEERTAAGATLTAQGVDSDKKTKTGTIAIVREGGAWKLASENW